MRISYYGETVTARPSENPITGRPAFDLYDERGRYCETVGERFVEERKVPAFVQCPHFAKGYQHDHLTERVPCAKCKTAGCRDA